MLDRVCHTCCRYILSDLLELAGYEPRERSNVAITGIQTDAAQVGRSGITLLAHGAPASRADESASQRSTHFLKVLARVLGYRVPT